MITEYSINLETKSKQYLIDFINQLVDTINDINKTLVKQERELKIKNEYFQLIHDIGYDYDGLEKAESLKQLIDELIDLANKGYIADDKAAIYDDFNGHKKNILLEPIGDDKSDSRKDI